MTTFAAFVTALKDLNVTGVATKLTEPPLSLNGAALPAQWVQLPQLSNEPMTFEAMRGWPVLRAQFIVAVEPVGQGTQPANWSQAINMVDYVDAALGVSPSPFCKGRATYAVRPGKVNVAGVDYWAVIADVIGHG